LHNAIKRALLIQWGTASEGITESNRIYQLNMQRGWNQTRLVNMDGYSIVYYVPGKIVSRKCMRKDLWPRDPIHFGGVKIVNKRNKSKRRTRKRRIMRGTEQDLNIIKIVSP
jgi:hypothetical protein